MISKTWNLLDYCRGGVLTIEIENGIVSIIGKDWDYSEGTEKKSDQSNAEEWCRCAFSSRDAGWRTGVTCALQDLLTRKWVNKVWRWIDKNI